MFSYNNYLYDFAAYLLDEETIFNQQYKTRLAERELGDSESKIIIESNQPLIKFIYNDIQIAVGEGRIESFSERESFSRDTKKAEGDYDLALMSQLPRQDENLAKPRTIYLSPKGTYVVRDAEGIVQKGLLPKDSSINLLNLSNRLNNAELRAQILEVTSKAGHTPKSTYLFSTALSHIHQHLIDNRVNCTCAGYVMAEIWKLHTKNSINPVARSVNCPIDNSKISTLYTKIQRIAALARHKHRKNICIKIWESNEKRRNMLKAFFAKYPELIPNTVTLHFMPPYQETWNFTLLSCDLFLMPTPQQIGNYQESNKNQLYLYKDQTGIFYRLKGRNLYIKKSDAPSLEDILPLLSDDKFTQAAKKTKPCNDNVICEKILAITSKRGHTHPFAILRGTGEINWFCEKTLMALYDSEQYHELERSKFNTEQEETIGKLFTHLHELHTRAVDFYEMFTEQSLNPTRKYDDQYARDILSWHIMQQREKSKNREIPISVIRIMHRCSMQTILDLCNTWRIKKSHLLVVIFKKIDAAQTVEDVYDIISKLSEDKYQALLHDRTGVFQWSLINYTWRGHPISNTFNDLIKMAKCKGLQLCAANPAEYKKGSRFVNFLQAPRHWMHLGNTQSYSFLEQLKTENQKAKAMQKINESFDLHRQNIKNRHGIT